MIPSSHSTDVKVAILPDDIETLAEVMSGSGHVTGGLPNNINVTRSFNFQQGFDWFSYMSPSYILGATESASQLSMYNVLRKIRDRLAGDDKRVEDYYQPADYVLGHAKSFIEANHGKPWFSFVHLMEPHDPYFEHPYNGVTYGRAEHEVPQADKVDYLKEVYAKEITWMDAELGSFFAWMKESGIYDNTVIILTSDHGEEFLEHGGWWHGTTLYDEQIHLPLIFKTQRDGPVGVRVPWQVRQVDIPATVANLAGASLPDSWSGAPLLEE
jgi:arylsulfatase A-like enzyme